MHVYVVLSECPVGVRNVGLGNSEQMALIGYRRLWQKAREKK